MKRSSSSLVVTMTAMLFVASTVAVSAHHFDVTGEVPREDAPDILTPGPLGQPLAEWASAWWIWLLTHSGFDDLGCQIGDQGVIHFVPPPEGAGRSVACTVRADQYLLVAVSARSCSGGDAELEIRQTQAREQGNAKLVRQLAKKLRSGRADMAECVARAQATVSDPFLSIDGEPIPIDDRFWTPGAPFPTDRSMLAVPGYYVLLEPLTSGPHTIEYGSTHRDGKGETSDRRSVIELEVVDSGPTGPCYVRNVTRGTVGGWLDRVVASAIDGDRLEVQGTCVGGVVIDADLTLEGIGDTPTLDGRDEDVVLTITENASVELVGIDVTGGFNEDEGGGIVNDGQLTITGGSIRANYGEAGGGGIVNDGTLSLDGVELRDNVGNANGGGILNYGIATVEDSLLSGNTAISGGAISNGGEMRLTGSELRGNEAIGNGIGGGIYNYGQLAVEGSTVTENRVDYKGGGLYNTEPGTVTMDAASAVSSNTPDDCVGTRACP